jgi:hypothetical protein
LVTTESGDAVLLVYNDHDFVYFGWGVTATTTDTTTLSALSAKYADWAYK